jgi:hypothetical protein
MNLKRRITKLEKATGAGGFCACNGLEPIYKWTYADNGVLRDTKETEAELCETCGKLTNQHLIIIDYVSDWKP